MVIKNAIVWIYSTYENFNKEKMKTIDIIESMNISIQQNRKIDTRHINMNNTTKNIIARIFIRDN